MNDGLPTGLARLVKITHFKRTDFEQFAEGKDLSQIRAYVEAESCVGEAKEAALAWIRRVEREEELVEREIRSRAASAAERSAAAAERSARWAGWALFVSIAALAVAAWPYIRNVLG